MMAIYILLNCMTKRNLSDKILLFRMLLNPIKGHLLPIVEVRKSVQIIIKWFKTNHASGRAAQ